MNTIKPFITCLLILVTALSAEEPAGKANDVLPAACPKCQGALSTVPVLIGGPPSAEFAAQVTRGEALLGGCIGQDHQALICLECDRYLEEGAKIWQPLPGNFGAAKKLALLKGSSVTGTVKQSIGSFNLEGGGLTVGSTFELDLLNLPKERIDFKFQQTPESQPTSGGAILYRAPMKIEKVIQGRDRLGIFFSANDETGKFLIQVNVLGFEKGSDVYIQFYRDGSGGFISASMAEAKGVLK